MIAAGSWCGFAFLLESAISWQVLTLAYTEDDIEGVTRASLEKELQWRQTTPRWRKALRTIIICAPTALYFWYTVVRFRGKLVKGIKEGLIVHETPFRRHHLKEDLATVGLEIRLVRPDGTIDLVDADSGLEPKPKDTVDIRITTRTGTISLPVRRSSAYSIKDSLVRFNAWKTTITSQATRA